MSSNSRRSSPSGRPRNPNESSEDEERQRSMDRSSRRSPSAAQSRSPNARTAEEEEKRRQYREYLGIDPSQSWSRYYSVSAQEDTKELQGERSPKTAKRAPFQRIKIDLDAEGNYVLDDSSTKKQAAANRKKEMLEKWKLERIADSEDKQCSVCLEVVQQKQHAFDRKFGLLPNCPHVLCLGCAYQWKLETRLKKEGHQCPACRTPFKDIIPCKFYVKCKNQKQRILNIQKERAKEKVNEKRQQELTQDIARHYDGFSNSGRYGHGSTGNSFDPYSRYDSASNGFDSDNRYFYSQDGPYAAYSYNNYTYNGASDDDFDYLYDNSDFYVDDDDDDYYYEWY